LGPRRRELASAAERGGRAGDACGEERLRLAGGEPGEPGPVAAGGAVAARRPAHGLDGHARGHERLDVAMHGADGHVERARDLGGGELTPRLEQEEQRYEARRAHFLKMTEDVLFVWKDRAVNIWTDDWDDGEDWSGGGSKSRRLVPRGPMLGASVYELEPGEWMIYHAHHGSEELVLVLGGR